MSFKGRPPKKKIPIFRHPIPWAKEIADNLEDGDFPRFIDADGDEVPVDFQVVMDCAERFGFDASSEARCIHKKLCWESTKFWNQSESVYIKYSCILGKYDNYLKRVKEELDKLSEGQWSFAMYPDKIIASLLVQ